MLAHKTTLCFLLMVLAACGSSPATSTHVGPTSSLAASAELAELERFVADNGADPDKQDEVIASYWRIAELKQQAAPQPEYMTALADVVGAFLRSGHAPASPSAEYAARAQFSIAEASFEDQAGWTINVGCPATLDAYTETVIGQVERKAQDTRELISLYEPVFGYRSPTWTLAALSQQGRAYEVLAEGSRNAPFATPTDLSWQLRRVGAEQREEILTEVEQRVREIMVTRTLPVDCLAVRHYVAVDRAALAGGLETEHTRAATDGLRAYQQALGADMLTECVVEANASDPSFPLLSPDELARYGASDDAATARFQPRPPAEQCPVPDLPPSRGSLRGGAHSAPAADVPSGGEAFLREGGEEIQEVLGGSPSENEEPAEPEDTP